MCVCMHIQRDKSLLGRMIATEHLPESSVVTAFYSLSCFQLAEVILEGKI